jgi:hypothetical protein
LGFFKKILDAVSPPAKQGQPLWTDKADSLQRELQFFGNTFRVGMLAEFTTPAMHDEVMKYKKELDQLGYETEVLMYDNSKERNRNIYLPCINLLDLNKQGVPYTPRTDRFVKKKFDMLFNLYFSDNLPLQYLSKTSVAKCRYGAYRPHLMDTTDVFVYTEPSDDLQALITQINEVLKKQKYAQPKV